MRTTQGWVIASLLAASCAAEPIGSVEQPIVVCPGAATVEGIDVSHWQGTIDWDAIAADGIEFAFIRVSHGTGTSDTQFARNWPEARRAGVTRGVYQFFSAADDPIAQADLLIEGIGGALQPGDLPPVLDVEGQSVEGQTAATVIANMQTWLDYVEAQLGVRPIIYSAKYFWRDTLGDPDFTGYPLWVANYGVTCPDLPAPWTSFHFWQYTSTGSAGGISPIDRDVWNGDLDSLLAFAAGMAVCGDGACTGDETPETCASDCPVCASIPPLGREVDDTEVCFERGGTPSYWYEESGGYGGSLIWTYGTDAASADNYGVWSLTFDEAGRYRLEAYTAAPYAGSHLARYEIHHAGVDDTSVVDQTAVDGWSLVGEYEFAAGGDQRVRLGDDTGEPYADRAELVFDAIRLVRLDPPAPSDGGVIERDAGPLPPGTDAGPDGTLTASCGCRAPSGRGGLTPLALIGAALALLRARRRRG